MAIDPRYLLSPNLQQYFVDKDTGFPLAGGKVYFYEDNNRSAPKPAYQISGSPPNYTFTALPNPLILSSVGTVQDGSGNDIVPYLLPLDSGGNLQFYYVEVYSSGDVLQFVREAWPPDAVAEGGVVQQESDLNLIPNGQFAWHNNIPANVLNGFPAGRITSPVTDVAPGGWTFERPVGSTAVDTVTFNRINGFVTDPTSSPRYEIFITTNGGSPSDAFKDLRKKYKDVNKFASDTQEYSVFFSARTITGGTFDLNLNLIKNYGTGGDPEEVINIDTFTITDTEQNFQSSFVWGANTGKLIGPLNDDFCQLSFSFPTGTAVDFAGTDFVNLLGSISITAFPLTTDDDFTARSIIPRLSNADFDGSTLGLPLIRTKNGVDYDSSQVGKVFPTVKAAAGFGEYLCDGTAYRTDAYSPDGIPHSRVQAALTGFASLSANQSIPSFGTGLNYVTATRCGTASNIIVMSANNFGVVASTADGAAPTGFTFTDISTGIATQRHNSWTSQNGLAYWIESLVAGDARTTYSFFGSNQTFTANTTSFTTPSYLDTGIGEIYGNPVTKQLVKGLSVGIPAASTYIIIPIPGTPASNDSAIWFTLNGAGAQPSLGAAVYIRVNLFSTMTNADVAYCISRAIYGSQNSYIVPVGGASIPANSYFTFVSNGQLYYVWYSFNGTGTDPLVPGAIGIPVTYNNASTVSDVALATSIAINRMYFAVPNLRGQIIKGWDSTGSNDINVLNRYPSQGSRLDSLGFGSNIGSNQPNALLSHSHNAIPSLSGGTAQMYNAQTSPTPATQLRGLGSEGTGQNDPKNTYLNYVIKI